MHSVSIEKFYLKKKNSNNLIYIFLVLGVAFRLFHFFYNRSLWMDEVYLSSSLIKYDLNELITKPLFYQQKAPIGFLILVKLFLKIFGNNELALRIVPLISGTAAMLLFVPVAKFFLQRMASVLAIGIFCLAPALVYHSVEIKQYSTELFGTIASLYLYTIFKNRTDYKGLLIWSLLGAIILWFSYSSIFILGGIGIGLAIHYIYSKQWRILFKHASVFSIWLLSFVVNYVLFTHKHAESEWIAYWFRTYQNFMPFPPKSVDDLKWFAYNLYNLMDYPLGLVWKFKNHNATLNTLIKIPLLATILLLTGIYAGLKKNLKQFLILIIPISLTLIASGLELYPLIERFWVFISPIFILFICFGFELMSNKLKSIYLSLTILVIVLSPTIFQIISDTVQPDKFYFTKKSFQRESLFYINNKYKPGDAVYVYWNNLPGYRLYKNLYQFKFSAIEGSDKRKVSNSYPDYYNKLHSDFSQFSNSKRVWVIYNKQFNSDIGNLIDEPKWYYEKSKPPVKHLVDELSKTFKINDQFETKDLIVYLFIR